MRVVLASDGSPSAVLAAELVGNMSWPVGTSIDVVRVVEEHGQDLLVGPWPAVGFSAPPDVGAAAIQDAEAALVAVVEPLRKRGLKTNHAVLRGRPADALLDWIDRHRPDLVIVGNRGISAIERTLLGSVSSELVDHSPVPVLVARKPTLKRVVIAVDGSDIASEAVATARRWPFLTTTQMRTLCVAPAPVSWWPGEMLAGSTELARVDRDQETESLREHEAIASDAAASLRVSGFDVAPEVLGGSPGPTIVAFASAWGADLVIMGSHGRTGLTRLLLGSVARNVLHHASCSVLIVRRHADAVRGRRAETVSRPWTILASH